MAETAEGAGPQAWEQVAWEVAGMEGQERFPVRPQVSVTASLREPDVPCLCDKATAHVERCQGTCKGSQRGPREPVPLWGLLLPNEYVFQRQDPASFFPNSLVLSEANNLSCEMNLTPPVYA